jgi:probable rRNA maturation factor
MILELVEQRTRPGDLPLAAESLAGLVADLGRGDWVLNLVLVDDHVMADLYGRWYGGEGVTDVLSFTYLEDVGAGAPALAAGESGAARDMWLAPGDLAPPVVAGEVILAPSFVADRCGREGWDLAAEWALLTVHGALHVLGWEHGDDEAREAMRTREAALLAARGFGHPLRDGQGES